MRVAGKASDEASAQRIVDGLLVEAGIESEARAAGDGSEIWIHDHDRLDEARGLITRFERDGIPDVGRHAARLRRTRAREHEDWAQRSVDVGRRFRVAKSTGDGIGALTLLLVGGSVIVALAGGFGEAPDERMWNLTIDDWTSTEPLERIREGEWWRLVTPIFLHFGIFHIVFNMLWLWRLGNAIERNHGVATMGVVVVLSALAGNLGQYYVSGPAFGGMSGVVYGAFGFVWMQSRYDPRHAYVLAGRTPALMMIWFVLGVTGVVGRIANLGHAGGLAVGLLLGVPAYVRYLLARRTRPDFEEEGAWAAVHVTRFARFRRRFVDPWVPAWFLLITLGVAALELRDGGPWQTELCIREFDRVVRTCDAKLTAEGDPTAFYEELARVEAAIAPLADDAARWDEICPALLARTEEVAGRLGCDE